MHLIMHMRTFSKKMTGPTFLRVFEAPGIFWNRQSDVNSWASPIAVGTAKPPGWSEHRNAVAGALAIARSSSEQ